MKHASFVFPVMSAKVFFHQKLLPWLDLLSIMPLTVQKVLIQNIVEVIKGALHLNIQLFDQFWYLVNTVGKINQELATVAETIAMPLFDDCLKADTKDLYDTTLSIFNQIETKTQIQTKRVNGINFWPNITEQESYPATKSSPNQPADKASRMPHAMGTKLGSHHCHTSNRNRPESVALTFMIDIALSFVKRGVDLQQAAQEVRWRQRSTTWPTWIFGLYFQQCKHNIFGC